MSCVGGRSQTRASNRDRPRPVPSVVVTSIPASTPVVDPVPQPGESTSSADDSLPGQPPTRPFSDLFESLSEPDRYYFSHNYLSNETSLLQIAPQLVQRSAGGAYVGVGPEQNYTYIALTRPSIAFIVDIRRRNALLHLLYKAIFTSSVSRSQFMTLLLGRAYRAEGEPGAAADIDAVIQHAQSMPPDRALFVTSHASLVRQIEGYGITLTPWDRRALFEAHTAFFDGQLELRFELLMPTAPRYPTLRQQLAIADPFGARRGFLATESSFRFIKRMHEENRIIPVVGDFGGTKAMPGVAAYLRAESIPLGVLYASNVEEFLFEQRKWDAWKRNVSAFPTDESSVIVRTWMNHNPRHPLQLPGHRTTTLMQKVSDFNERVGSRRLRNYRELVMDPTHVTTAPDPPASAAQRNP